MYCKFDFGVKNVSKQGFGMEIWPGKLIATILDYLVGENHKTKWFHFTFPASKHNCLKNCRSQKSIFLIFMIFSMIFMKMFWISVKNHVFSGFASIFGWFFEKFPWKSSRKSRKWGKLIFCFDSSLDNYVLKPET